MIPGNVYVVVLSTVPAPGQLSTKALLREARWQRLYQQRQLVTFPVALGAFRVLDIGLCEAIAFLCERLDFFARVADGP